MTGAEHYLEAERLLRDSRAALDLVYGKDGVTDFEIGATEEVSNAAVQRALVHATLARVAATVDQGMRPEHPDWRAVLVPDTEEE